MPNFIAERFSKSFDAIHLIDYYPLCLKPRGMRLFSLKFNLLEVAHTFWQLIFVLFAVTLQVLISHQRVILFKIVPLLLRVFRFYCCLEDSDLLNDVYNIRFLEYLLEPVCFELVATTRFAATKAKLGGKSVQIEYECLYSTPLNLVDFFASDVLLRLARPFIFDGKSIVK